jgi:CAP-Gly domain-containing linker protein 1
VQEVEKLTHLLEESRANEQAAIRRLENSSNSTILQELQNSLADRSAELDALKKRSNRDFSMNGTEPPKSSSKLDLSTAREEITGLKSVNQIAFEA